LLSSSTKEAILVLAMVVLLQPGCDANHNWLVNSIREGSRLSKLSNTTNCMLGGCRERLS
jgi:hypothetical protein